MKKIKRSTHSVQIFSNFSNSFSFTIFKVFLFFILSVTVKETLKHRLIFALKRKGNEDSSCFDIMCILILF